MNLKSQFYPNLYKDSVSLMTVSAKILAVPGIESASVVMTTATNVENLKHAGLGDFEVRPNDLVVALSGTDDACAKALKIADDLLSAKAGGDEGGEVKKPLTSLQMAVTKDPERNFALVSVPGDYAAAEAMKALRLGMDVMMFSDNVPLESELVLKQFAQQHNLMVMGPDCGTAIVNGVPLGFANVIRRGPIGVVGASGTGTQEVTVRIHQLGSGVSQALGTGGRDLNAKIGGISMLHGLRALQEDPETKVIVLVSKPPAREVAEKILAAATSSGKPVVAIFLGADPATVTRPGVYGAAYLAQAAEMAVDLANGHKPNRKPITMSNDAQLKVKEGVRRLAPGQRYVRGVFSGGTFCYEAQLIHAAAGITAFSNEPVTGNRPLANVEKSVENTIIDMGDDLFTQGRPHPMIDPTLRNARIRDDIDDPTTAVVLFDVVLGYGSSSEPTVGLINTIARGRTKAQAEKRRVAFIGYVCGTDDDPQNRASIVSGLQSVGVHVASSNAEAATWSAAVLSEINKASK
jgi:succinyl-CoA synthetase alpha subunit